jgi:hypothetical protein
MTTFKKHHNRNKLWVVSEEWLHLIAVEEDGSDGNLLYHAHFGVLYRTGTICFVGSEHGRRENWKVGVFVNKMD